MTKEQVQDFLERIDKLQPSQQPKFGKMNANQMLCHCADQLRLAMGLRTIQDYEKISPNEVLSLIKSRKTVPTPKGLGQTEGDGTSPTSFENDRKILKELLQHFAELPEGFEYQHHPYFGQIDKAYWTQITVYHLNHHLKQFKL